MKPPSSDWHRGGKAERIGRGMEETWRFRLTSGEIRAAEFKVALGWTRGTCRKEKRGGIWVCQLTSGAIRTAELRVALGGDDP